MSQSTEEEKDAGEGGRRDTAGAVTIETPEGDGDLEVITLPSATHGWTIYSS